MESKAQKDTEYGPKTEIMEEFGSHPRRNGKERKAEFRIQRFISKSIPGILQARGAQAGWERRDMQIRARCGWDRATMQVLELNRDLCYPCAARSFQPSRRRLPCQLPTERSRSLRRIGWPLYVDDDRVQLPSKIDSCHCRPKTQSVQRSSVVETVTHSGSANPRVQSKHREAK